MAVSTNIKKSETEMGSAVSSIDKVQSLELTSKLKEKFEELNSKGLSDAEIQEKITNEYNIIMKSFMEQSEASAWDKLDRQESQTGRKIVPVRRVSKDSGITETKPQQKTLESSNSSKSIRAGSFCRETVSSALHAASTPKSSLSTKMSERGTGNGGATRRRSFDGIKKTDDIAVALLAASNSALSVGEAESDQIKKTESNDGDNKEAVDSWDSVVQQPFCDVCAMGFKSISFLDRHVKYSDLHVHNVKKLADKAEKEAKRQQDALLAPIVSTEEENLQPPTLSNQVEGKHYRLLYSGSKLFWRTQEQVDVSIYHHILPDTIEIICYDTAKAKEFNRIYVSYNVIKEIVATTVTPDSGIEKSNGSGNNKINSSNKAGSTAEPTSAANEEHIKLTRYIIQRLQLITAADSSKSMEFAKMSSDSYKISPILTKISVVLTPVVIARRRRTNAEEIEATINSLALDRAALVEATDRAQIVANLVYSGAASISAKKWWAALNKYRRLWVWAIRRVIRQKLVAETKVVLSKLEKQRRGSR